MFKKNERRVLREFVSEIYEKILREFFSNILKEDLVKN